MDDPFVGPFVAVSPATIAALAGVSFLAGFVDAIAGGGGLLTLPALLAAGLPPHAALATNKGQAAFGAVSSATSFWMKDGVDRRPRAPVGFITALIGSVVGAIVVLHVDPKPLKPIIVGLLVVAALFVLWPKKRRDVSPHAVSRWMTAPVGLALGFYDGFFGPGVGSLLIVAFVLVYGDALTRASGNAKIANLGSNVGALALFAASGAVRFGIALPMAASNAVGAFLGARVAIRRGDGFVRVVVLVVVSALLAKVTWDIVHG